MSPSLSVALMSLDLSHQLRPGSNFCLQKRNGMMDPDDFRACLISMGYDLVSAHLVHRVIKV